MNRTCILASLALLAAGSLPAQDLHRSGEALARSQSLRDSVAIKAAGDTICTGGWDYAADFDASGLRFVPALGTRAPVEQWLRMRPSALLRGDDVLLAFDAMAPAAPAHVGSAVEYARAAGITERYEVTSRGLQLSWRFETPLRGTGDLVVRYHVESNMAATSPAEPGGIGFRLEGIGGVDIGTVTGIDARGAEERGGIRRAGSVLELSLPARLVDRATYPLVLDPLIGTQFAAQTEAWNDSKPDVAYDATNDVYLVAFRRVFSATSMAVRAQRIASSGALVGGFLLVASGAQVFDPSVANVNDRDSFVIAWSQAPSILEPADVFCASVSAATGAISTPVVVAGDPAVDESEPDVGGEGLSGPHVLVAYRVRNAGIGLAYLTQLAAAPAGPVLATTTTVTTAVRAAAPALSKSPQGASARLLVWQDLSGSIGRIRARAVSPTGTLLGTELSVAQATVLGTIPIAQPGIADVDGDGQRFLVAYDFDQILSTEGNRDVYCRALSWDGTSLALQGASSTPLGQNNNDQFEPVVAWCRYKFLVAFTDQFLPGTNNYDIRAYELDASCRTCGTPILLSGLNTSLTRNIEFQPAVASKASGGSPLDDALLVFSEADDAPPFEGSLVGQSYSALGNGGAVTVVGSECGTGGIIESNGTPFAVGNPGFEIQLRSAPAGAIPFLLLGFPGGELTCGTCVYTNAVSTTFVLPSGSAIAYAYDLPCSAAAFVGIQVQAQWALLNTASSRCPLVPGLSFSPRLRLTLGL